MLYAEAGLLTLRHDLLHAMKQRRCTASSTSGECPTHSLSCSAWTPRCSVGSVFIEMLPCTYAAASLHDAQTGRKAKGTTAEVCALDKNGKKRELPFMLTGQDCTTARRASTTPRLFAANIVNMRASVEKGRTAPPHGGETEEGERLRHSALQRDTAQHLRQWRPEPISRCLP